MTRTRAISQLLVFVALVGALGTDYMAQAGSAVRADAVVDVAERIAARLSRAFDQKDHRPAAVQFARQRLAALSAARPSARPEDVRVEHLASDLRLLYLPPPSVA